MWSPLQEQSNNNYGPNVSSGTLTFANPCTPGSLLVFMLTGQNNPTVTVSDGVNPSYTPITGVLGAGYGNLWTFYVVNSSGAALTVTWSATGTITYPKFQVCEFSGNTATPLDAVGTAGGSGIVSAQVAANSASIAVPELIIGIPIIAGGAICAPAAGWNATDPGNAIIYATVTSNGNYNPTFTTTGSTMGVVAVSFIGVAAATISSLVLSPTSVLFPAISTGTVTLGVAAPVGGVVVFLSSSDTTISTVPVSVTVLSGNTTATFTVTSQNKTGSATITASVSGGSNGTAVLGVTANPAAFAFVNEAHDFSYGIDQPSISLAVTKGNLLVAWLTAAGPGSGDPSGSYGWTLYDGVNTYYPIKLGQAGGYGYGSMWVAIAERTATVTTKFFGYATSGVIPGTGILQASRMDLQYAVCQIVQFSGAYGNPLDAFASTSGSSTAPADSVATGLADELVVGVVIPIGSSVSTPAAGWFAPAGNPSLIYAVEPAAATYTPTFAMSPTGSWGIIVASFKAALTSVNHTIAGSVGVHGVGATVLFISTTTALVATAVAGAGGAYTSPALADDTYVVIPEMVGTLFTSTASSLPQAMVTTSGANSTGNNFTGVVISANVRLTTTFTDTMIRANENPLSDGGKWTGDGTPIPPQDPQCQLLSHECVMADATIYANYAGPWSGDGISMLTGVVLPNNQFSQFQTDVVTVTGGADVQVRTGSLDASGYAFGVNNNGDGTGRFNLGGIVPPFSLPYLSASGTSYLFVWQATLPWADGDTLGLAAVGTTLYMFHNGAVIGNYSDASLSSGSGCILLGGQTIPDAQVSQFMVGSATLLPSPVNLLSNSGVAVSAGSTVVNTGNTVVNGDLDLSPGSVVIGFPPGIITGTEHIDDATAVQSQLDLTTAYTQAANATGAVTIATALDAATLNSGVYTSSAGTFSLSGGTLTLDAQGDPNAVWIFQMATTLVTSAGSTILLINSAAAANVFWQVGSSATIGANNNFVGTILAAASITITGNGTTITGRLLASAEVAMGDAEVILPGAVTYTISGNAGIAGATVTLGGTASGTTTADSLGNYQFTELVNGTYTITPTKTGYTFTPNGRTAIINSANRTGVDFTAMAVATGFPPVSIYAAGYQPHTIVCGTMRGPAIHDFSTE